MKPIKNIPYEFCVDCGCKHLKNNKCTLEGEYCNEGREKCEKCWWGIIVDDSGCIVRLVGKTDDYGPIPYADKFDYCPICGFKIKE